QGLSRLCRLAGGFRQQGRAGLLGHAAQGRAQQLRQCGAEPVLSAVQAQRRGSHRLADLAVLRWLWGEPAGLQPQAGLATATGYFRGAVASVEFPDAATPALDGAALLLAVQAPL